MAERVDKIMVRMTVNTDRGTREVDFQFIPRQEDTIGRWLVKAALAKEKQLRDLATGGGA